MKSDPFVILDTMDLWIEIANAPLRELVKRADILIVNDSEAKKLSGERNVIRAGDGLLRMGAKSAIVKAGEYGAMLFHPDGFFAVPAYPVRELRDPTGAGDTFGGGAGRSVGKRRSDRIQTYQGGDGSGSRRRLDDGGIIFLRQARRGGARGNPPPRRMRQENIGDLNMATVLEIAKGARAASLELAAAPTELKNAALMRLAELLLENAPSIIEANARDLEKAEKAGLSSPCSTTFPRRKEDRGNGGRSEAGGRPPRSRGETIESSVRPNGLKTKKSARR